MTEEQLKSSILKMAVEGKLVAQNPADKPASALLKKIKKEKQALIKDKKLKKPAHTSEIFRRGDSFFEKVDGKERCIDDELPFAIPDGWEWVRLDSASNMYTGDSINETEKNCISPDSQKVVFILARKILNLIIQSFMTME